MNDKPVDCGGTPPRSYCKPALRPAPSLVSVTAVSKILSVTKPSGGGACWVARAVYGADNPRWLLYRDWLGNDAPLWFARAYLRFGERAGRVVARSRLLRRALRPLMDRAIRARFGL